MTAEIQYGVYKCNRCGKDYTVNVAHTFGRCVPELCHECVEYLETQYASVPIDEDGKETEH